MRKPQPVILDAPSLMGESGSAHRLPDYASVCGVMLVMLGGAVVAGWYLDLPTLKGIAPDFATMKINSAVCFALGGLALLLRQWGRRHPTGARVAADAARLLAAAVALVGLATALQHVVGVDFRIDQLLLADRHVGPMGIPGRMSVISAVGFVLFGIALVLPDGPRAGLFASGLCTAGLVGGFMALVGYLYNVRIIYQPLPATAIALHSAAGLVILFLGALLSRPEAGWMKMLLRAGSVGLMVRMLLPVLILLPVLVGWLGLLGVRRDLYGAGGQTALVVTASTLLLAGVALLIARRAAIADDALREQRHIYRSVLGNSLDAFIMIGQDGRVLDWNLQAERVFGWSAAEALGQPVEQLVLAEPDRTAHRTGIARFAESGQDPVALSRRDMTACRRNGEAFTAEIIVVPIRIGGVWRFGCFVRDISDQIATEEQLRQSQKMDAIGQLTGGIAHDLNNLLTVVIGNLDLLVPQTEADHRKLAEPALQAAERGASLVHRLLAFSRRQALSPERLDLNTLVVEVHELIRPTLGEDVEIELELAASVWPVFADPGQVENALLNLVVNARDAMPQGGTLTIETQNMHLDEHYAAANREVQAGDYVMLAVSDTGVGMTEEVLEHAFEPFFTTKEVGKGSGLGLSMIYGFAKQSSGHAKIYSEPGLGTTVRLYLPRDREAPVEPAAAPDSLGSAMRPGLEGTAGETILVVEDDEAVRVFVTSVLARLGYTVLAAADAGEALDLLAEHPEIDLLFTDVVIPGGMSGRELAETATKLVPRLKVLYTSGYTENSIVHQGKLDRGVDFLAKPYRREELVVKVQSVLAAGHDT